MKILVVHLPCCNAQDVSLTQPANQIVHFINAMAAFCQIYTESYFDQCGLTCMLETPVLIRAITKYGGSKIQILLLFSWLGQVHVGLYSTIM